MPIGFKRRNRGQVISQAVLESLENRMLLAAPLLDAPADVAMPSALNVTKSPKTVQIPLTATDADGDTLTYTVTSSNPNYIVPILHTGNPFLKLTVQLGANISEVQTLKGSAVATAGTYTLSFGGNTTSVLPYNATTADVQAALRLLAGAEGVTVGGYTFTNTLTSTNGMTFTFPQSSGNVTPITIDATALKSSTGAAVTQNTQGIQPVSEVQTLRGTSVATGGTYTLSFGGNTTGALNFDATTSDVQAAIRLLAGAEEVVVSGDPLTSTSGMIFTFPVSAGNVASITIDATALSPSSGLTITETTRGGGTSEVQTIQGTAAATAGTFTLSFGGNTTTALAFNATTADVQAALRLLAGAEGVIVSGSPLTSISGMIFTFPPASGNVASITINTASLTATPSETVTETIQGTLLTGIGEVQTLKGSSSATAGTFTLSYGGHTTSALAYSATIADVQAALRLLAGAENVVVSGNPLTSTSGMIFTFPAASGNVDLITINGTSLTSATPFAFTETTRGFVSGATADITLQLFKDWAPQTVKYITGLVQSGFYDNLIFHRIVKGFMAQGGDPLGTGSGGPQFRFADEFNQNLMFTSPGLLAMANSGDETNGSQFFITDFVAAASLPRNLDFNHTIFGQLVRGREAFETMMLVPVQLNSSNENSKPVTPVKIISAEIVQDVTDTVLTLQAKRPDSAIITVTVNDGHGGSDVRTFNVVATADTSNTPSFLATPTPNLYVPAGQAITIPVNAVDLEGDTRTLSWVMSPDAKATVVNNGTSITVTPISGFTGTIQFTLKTTRVANSTTDFDTDTFVLSVGDKAIHGQFANFSAIAGVNRTGLVASFTSDDTAATADRFAALINWGDGSEMEDGIITKVGSQFTITGTHAYARAGSFPITVNVTTGELATDVNSGALDLTRTGSSTTIEGMARVGAVATTTVNIDATAVARAGVTFSQYGTIHTPAGRTLTGTVNYADGTATSALTIAADGTFSLLKKYAKAGSYNITITIRDGVASPIVQRVLVTVLASGPAAVVSGDKTGVPLQVRSIKFSASDAAAKQPAGSYYYSVDWGDGSPVYITAAGTAGASHAYAKAGVFTAKVRAIDARGAAGPVKTFPITITSVGLFADLWDSNNKGLMVFGTDQNDNIKVGIGGRGGLAVTVNGKVIGEYVPSGFLYIWGYGGNDIINVSANVPSIAIVFGGDGNDTINAGGGLSIVSGGGGNDTIRGPSQRSLLIGGNGADKITGQGQDDVLIAGSTDYDDNAVALIALLARWVQTGTSNTYAARITAMKDDSSGTNSAIKTTSVHDDDAVDTLTGGAGGDWYISNNSGDPLLDKDNIVGKAGNEQIFDIAPVPPADEATP